MGRGNDYTWWRKAGEAAEALFYASGWAARAAYALGLQGRLRVDRRDVYLPLKPFAEPLRVAFASNIHAGRSPILVCSMRSCGRSMRSRRTSCCWVEISFRCITGMSRRWRSGSANCVSRPACSVSTANAASRSGLCGVAARSRRASIVGTQTGMPLGFPITPCRPHLAAVFDGEQRDDGQHDAGSQQPLMDQAHGRAALAAQDCSRLQRTVSPVKKS